MDDGKALSSCSLNWSGESLVWRLWRMFRLAFRENLAAGIAIQLFAVILVGSYYLVPPVGMFWNRVALMKQDCGLLAAVVSTSFFGGLVPFCYLCLTGRIGRGDSFRNFVFFLLFWGYRGGEVELFYRFQAWMFGDSPTVATVIKKMVFDQFVYNPFWATWVIAVGFLWQHHRFDFRATFKALNRDFLVIYLPGMMFSTWVVWIPAVSIIYCLPQALQVPLFNLVLCFFVLLAASLKKR